MAVEIPEIEIAAAYQGALAHAHAEARGNAELAESLTDAATDAVMWAIAKCNNAETFRPFTRRAVHRWVSRRRAKAAAKWANRPTAVALPEHTEARAEKPTQPALIQDLPEDLAFIVRLYMVDGFTLREIGMLTNQSPNTVDLKLKRAAAILAEGRLTKPERRKGEKRLTPG